jgi:Adenomatosis polyposis coli down-regulated 1
MALTLSLGCGDSDGDGDGEGASTTAARLEGTWESTECEVLPTPDGSIVYKTRRYTFEPERWLGEIRIHGDDATCAAAIVTIVASGPYEARGTSARVARAGNYFFGLAARTITPATEAAATFLTDGRVCGRADWAASVPVDVHEGGCPELNVPPSAACAGEHETARIEGDRLFLGARSASTADDACAPDNFAAALLEYPLGRR